LSESVQRFVALDLHKAYVLVGGVNSELDVVLKPVRVLTTKLDGWVKKHLRSTDVVVIEAGTNTWYVYDLIAPLVERVVVANAHAIKLIGSSLVKTDRTDVLALAHLLAVGLIPEVWVPPQHVRDLRTLVMHRRYLVKRRTAAKNRLQNLLMAHHVVAPAGDPFAAKNREWWDELRLSGVERLRVTHDMQIVTLCSTMIAEADAELARLSVSDEWVDQTAFLIQLPGIALVNAMTILSAIGDIERFSSAKKLVGYSGLGARVRASGKTHRCGGITKQGRTELRTTMVEAAWKAVENDEKWREQYERLAARTGSKRKAIVAIARKLLVVVWNVLSQRVPDRNARVGPVARSLMNWGTHHRVATSLGLSRAAFVRRELDRLGLGARLKAFQHNGRTYRLPLPGSVPLAVEDDVGAVAAAA
jgi:transposase